MSKVPSVVIKQYTQWMTTSRDFCSWRQATYKSVPGFCLLVPSSEVNAILKIIAYGQSSRQFV